MYSGDMMYENGGNAVGKLWLYVVQRVVYHVYSHLHVPTLSIDAHDITHSNLFSSSSIGRL